MGTMNARTRLGFDRSYIWAAGWVPAIATPPSEQVIRDALRTYLGDTVAEVSVSEKKPNIFVGTYTPLRDGLIVANVMLPVAKLGAYNFGIWSNSDAVPDVGWETLGSIEGKTDDLEDTIKDASGAVSSTVKKILGLGTLVGLLFIGKAVS